MELSNEQIRELQQYNKVPDDDNTRIKKIIKSTIIEDPLILYLLNNRGLEEADADPSDYLGVNILDYYLIHPTQHNVQNYICVGTDYNENPRYNDGLKYQIITFYILCEEKNLVEKYTGLPRHDLIAARIKNSINWTNKFGTQCILFDDRESVTDNDYATRTLKFQMITAKNLVKTKNGITTVVNKIGG